MVRATSLRWVGLAAAGAVFLLGAIGLAAWALDLDLRVVAAIVVGGALVMAIAIEHVRLYERVRRQAAELEAAQEALVRQERLAGLGRLAGSVAHELRNPLAVIKNAVYLLRMAAPAADESGRKHLATLEREVATTNRIVTQLLDYARKPSPERVPVRVNDLVREHLGRTDDVGGRAELVLRLADDLPPIAADPGHLAQILDNLVRNAAQAMPEGGRLTIETARHADGRVTLAVSDTGTGITPEDQARIFEPLFTAKAKGIGLGLAVVKQLAEAGGGTIEVDSVPGQGSRFTLRFPPL